MNKYDVTFNIIIDCEMSSELLSQLLESEAAFDDFVEKNCFKNNKGKVLTGVITHTWLQIGAPAKVKAERVDYILSNK
jgi:hypothetical protein